jgi:hypothetical protein
MSLARRKTHGNLRWGAEHVAEWVRLKQEGLTLKQIAAKSGVDETTVWKKLDEWKRRGYLL